MLARFLEDNTRGCIVSFTQRLFESLAYRFFVKFHRRKHRIRIEHRQMAAGQIHLLLGDVRRLDAHITGLEFGFLGQLFQFFHNGRAFRQPERQARPDKFRVNGVQPHLRAYFPVVALLRLFDHREIFVELGLVLERRAVDALELRVALVALVIRAGHGGELERAHVAGAHHVRPGAQVDEIAVLEIRNRLALGNGFEVADLEFARIARTLGQSTEPAALGILQGLLARDDDFLETDGWP